MWISTLYSDAADRSPSHCTSMMRFGSFFRSAALGQSARCTLTPRPRVTNPMMSSPGTGLQHLDRRTRMSSRPFTTTPLLECASCFLGRFTLVIMGGMMPVEPAPAPTRGFSDSSVARSTRIFSMRLAMCCALSLPRASCTNMSSASLKPMASATIFSARAERALDSPTPCLRISRMRMSWPSARSVERVCFEK